MLDEDKTSSITHLTDDIEAKWKCLKVRMFNFVDKRSRKVEIQNSDFKLLFFLHMLKVLIINNLPKFGFLEEIS